MLTYEMMKAYFEAFDSFPFMGEPSGGIMVEDENGNTYEIDMTPEEWFATIQESKTAGQNLFFERGRKVEDVEDGILL